MCLSSHNFFLVFWVVVFLSLFFLLYLSLVISLFLFVYPTTCVTLLLRIANRVGEDSYCRGGIVNIRGVCCSARYIRPNSSTVLWRFRASTSNSPSGRSRLHAHTLLRRIDHTFAQQGIRVYEDDHFQPPKWQVSTPKALRLLPVSI